MNDPHELQRFLSAQDADGTFDRALDELRRGAKHSHWMWFVFPQIAGLGSSPTAQHYAIRSRAEAVAYLAHPILGARLHQCVTALTALHGLSAVEILGGIDAVKLRSSMTLFHRVAPDDPAFTAVLAQYFGGAPDPATDAQLARTG